MAQETNEYREQRLQSMAALREMGFEPYGCRYDHTDLRDVRANFVSCLHIDSGKLWN